MTDKHRQSEVTLRQSDNLMTSSSQAPPTSMRLTRRVTVGGACYSVSHYGGSQIYVGDGSEVCLVKNEGESSRVLSVDGYVLCVSVFNNLIYTLIHKSNIWTVRVYDSDYLLSRSWRHYERCTAVNQMAVRKDCLLVPHRGSKTIIQYSLTGEAERRIPCPILKNAATWMFVMPSRCDAVTVSCDGIVSCIDVSTGNCVWSTDSLEEPTAACCDNADRVFVDVGGRSDRMKIAILDGDTGKSVFPSQTHPYFSYCSTFVSFN